MNDTIDLGPGADEDDDGEDTGMSSRLVAVGDRVAEEEGPQDKLDVAKIDAYWLQRSLAKYYTDAR
jgi:hypothetical protein